MCPNKTETKQTDVTKIGILHNAYTGNNNNATQKKENTEGLYTQHKPYFFAPQHADSNVLTLNLIAMHF